MLVVPDLATISHGVVSSTYLCVMHEACRLSTNVMNVNGALRYEFVRSLWNAGIHHQPVRHHLASLID